MTDDERQALEEYTDALVEGTPEARQRADHVVHRLHGLWPQVKGFDADREHMLHFVKLKQDAEPETDPDKAERDAAKLDKQAQEKEKEAQTAQKEAERLRAEASATREKQTHAATARETFVRMSSGRMAASLAARKYLGETAEA
jgi:hypothetical protein